jgi:hypothetical protein
MVARSEIAGISAGYCVNEWEISDEDGRVIDPDVERIRWDEDGLTFTATRWSLHEASLVTVPANQHSGIRSTGSGYDRAFVPHLDRLADVHARMWARQRMFDANRQPLVISVVDESVGEGQLENPASCSDQAAAVVCQQDHGGSNSISNVDEHEEACRSAVDDAGMYPVPSRSPETNLRIAGHEIGHVWAMRALSASPISYVSITRGDGFEGRACGANYKESQCNLEDQTGIILDGCARIEKLAPGLGSSRIESAELYIKAQTMVIELVAGGIAEKILFAEIPQLSAEHDKIEARAVAAIACASPRSVDAMLAYAEAEAENVIRENLNVVLALVDALVESPRGKLTGQQVDAVIESAIDRERHLTFEVGRRADWRCVEQNAADFAAGLES